MTQVTHGGRWRWQVRSGEHHHRHLWGVTRAPETRFRMHTSSSILMFWWWQRVTRFYAPGLVLAHRWPPARQIRLDLINYSAHSENMFANYLRQKAARIGVKWCQERHLASRVSGCRRPTLFCKCTNKCKLPSLLSTVKAGSNTISADVVPVAGATHEIRAQETAAMEAKSKMRWQKHFYVWK